MAITKAVKSEFRVERGIAITVVTGALLVGLAAAIYAAFNHQWEDVTSILYGASGVCTVGVSALFYMYNRSLLFMERMAALEKGNNADGQ